MTGAFGANDALAFDGDAQIIADTTANCAGDVVNSHRKPHRVSSSEMRPAARLASSSTRALSGSMVMRTHLNAGVFESGSVVVGTSTFASGKYISALPARMS